VKHEFQAGMELDPSEIIFTVYPLALFRDSQIGRNAKLLLTLQYRNGPSWVEGPFSPLIDGDLREKPHSEY
jgi:hypothetical protein